jgi:hypothetical protein
MKTLLPWTAFYYYCGYITPWSDMTLYASSCPSPDITCKVALLQSATITLPTDDVTISQGLNDLSSVLICGCPW